MREYLNRVPDLTRIPLPNTLPPSSEAVEADEWLRTTARPLGGPRPVLPPAPSDFTARVMARIEAPAPVVSTPQQRPLADILRPLGIAGGLIGFSGLLVLASLAFAYLAAPAALVTLLNMIVAALVTTLLLLTPLLDAAAALAANSTLMFGLVALTAGFAVIWSRMGSPSTQLAREA